MRFVAITAQIRNISKGAGRCEAAALRAPPQRCPRHNPRCPHARMVPAKSSY